MGVEFAEALLRVRKRPLLGGVFWHDDFARIETFEGGEEVFWCLLRSEEELARGQVEPSGIECLFAERKREQKVVTLRVDLSIGEACAWGDDAGELALD